MIEKNDEILVSRALGRKPGKPGKEKEERLSFGHILIFWPFQQNILIYTLYRKNKVYTSHKL